MIDTNNVSVIIPIYNEEKHISKVLECIINQDWKGNIEIVVADGNSTDNTIKIIEDIKGKLESNRTIKICKNPLRFIPMGLNIACENASNNIIVRVDGHTYAPVDYVKECVRALEEIQFKGIVGGRWNIKSNQDSIISKAISIGVSNPIGVGNALYRTFSGNSMELLDVDTVPFGAFTKKLWTKIGGYDEKLLYDEDYDFNYRIRKQGDRVVMNPKIVLDYFSRKDIKSLWIQYYRYGYWANKFCIKHKIIPTVRRLIPVVFIITILVMPLISKLLFCYLIALYVLTITSASVYEGIIKNRSIAISIALISVFPTLHFSYGIGSLFSLLNCLFYQSKHE